MKLTADQIDQWEVDITEMLLDAGCNLSDVAVYEAKALCEMAKASLPVEEKTTGWISVKDRLPGSELEWVLVAAEFDGPGDWRIKLGALDSEASTGWKILGASWTPTHWMPLPDAPDMKGEQRG